MFQFDKKDEKAIVGDYKGGMSMADIGEWYGVHSGVIRRVLIANGEPIRGPGRRKTNGTAGGSGARRLKAVKK